MASTQQRGMAASLIGGNNPSGADGENPQMVWRRTVGGSGANQLNSARANITFGTIIPLYGAQQIAIGVVNSDPDGDGFPVAVQLRVYPDDPTGVGGNNATGLGPFPTCSLASAGAAAGGFQQWNLNTDEYIVPAAPGAGVTVSFASWFLPTAWHSIAIGLYCQGGLNPLANHAVFVTLERAVTPTA